MQEKIRKQETLEEALKNELEFTHNSCRNIDFDLGFKTGGVIGAKWQQERMYTEEDMKKAFEDGKDIIDYCEVRGFFSKLTTEDWFEQFKTNKIWK